MQRLLNSGRVLLIILVTFFFSQACFGQSFDYEKRPRLNFKFLEANTDLELNPNERSISGSVRYLVEANVDNADTLSLQAVGLQVDSVRAESGKVEFRHNDGNLSIAVTDSSIIGQQYDVEIFYRGSPRFGILKSSEGSVWTSMLPRAHRHWLPSIDHPGVSFVSTLSLTVPQNYSVSATGVKTDEEVMESGDRKWTFRTGQDVPVSAIGFAAGQFNEEGVSYGIKRINTYAEPLSAPADQQQELAREAEHIIRQVENITGMDYPYEGLHIVILNDHHWEQKPYGASTIFLYKNRGDWINQLRRGIYGQWFGVYQREAQWSESWPIHLFKATLHYATSEESAELKISDQLNTSFSTVYEQFSAEKWNWWQNYNTWDRSSLQQTARRLMSGVLKNGPGVYTPSSYEEIWYQYSGQPSIDIPAFEPEEEQEGVSQDSIIYRVDYEDMPAQQQLQLVFTAQKGMLDAPVSLPVDVVSGGGKTTTSVTFTGSSDTAMVSLPAGTQNVRLTIPDDQNIYLEQHKPVPYLLHQLRNGETTEARAQAAMQIRYHSDNPDLQLALNDIMDQPMEPEVKAALLRAFGAITDGATGTQNRFLSALDSESPLVRSAALDVLQNYPQNQQITRQIRAFSGNEPNQEIAMKALEFYMQRIDSTEALGYANTLIQQDTAGTRAITAIGKLAEIGDTEAAVERAKFYIEPVYSFAVRKKAFMILSEHDQSEQVWEERVLELLSDSDPRIRFMTIQNLERIPGVDPDAVLENHRSNEFDARVWQVMGSK